MNTILCKISDNDAEVLIGTIIKVEAAAALYEDAVKGADYTPMAFKTVLRYYMEVLKEHKTLWRDLLIKYIGEGDTSKYYDILRFDTIKKVIFKLGIEGCALCEK